MTGALKNRFTMGYKITIIYTAVMATISVGLLLAHWGGAY